MGWQQSLLLAILIADSNRPTSSPKRDLPPAMGRGNAWKWRDLRGILPASGQKDRGGDCVIPVALRDHDPRNKDGSVTQTQVRRLRFS